MKEAAGEANLTVVAIILIAVVVAVATPLVNSLMKTTAYRSCCQDAGAIWQDNACYRVKDTGEKGSKIERKDLVGSNGQCITDVEVQSGGDGGAGGAGA